MEMVGIGFLMGAVVAIIAFLMGRISGERDNQGQFSVHSCSDDGDVHSSGVHNRNVQSNKGTEKDIDGRLKIEEELMVLNTLRVGCSQYERRIIDRITEKEEENLRWQE